MTSATQRIRDLDFFGGGFDHTILEGLASGEFDVIRVRKLVSEESCRHLARAVLNDPAVVQHDDVEGLRVVGTSHYQAARDERIALSYRDSPDRRLGWLRRLSMPYGSSFDAAFSLLGTVWPGGCRVLSLSSEGRLAPLTVRIYSSGVGIEPHLDVLAMESPSDEGTAGMLTQFGANVYVSVPEAGGELELFSTEVAEVPRDLSGGPFSVAREDLSDPAVVLRPEVGDLVIFLSHRLHAVTPAVGETQRITVSFFVGVESLTRPLSIWA